MCCSDVDATSSLGRACQNAIKGFVEVLIQGTIGVVFERLVSDVWTIFNWALPDVIEDSRASMGRTLDNRWGSVIRKKKFWPFYGRTKYSFKNLVRRCCSVSTDESHRLSFVRMCFRTKFGSCCLRKAVHARAARSPIDTTTPVHDSFLKMMEHTHFRKCRSAAHRNFARLMSCRDVKRGA